MVGGGDAASEFLHITESEKAFGAVHRVVAVFPDGEAEGPELLD
jgi:hypothetical protein